MASYQWYLTKKRQDLLAALINLPDAGRKDTSVILEELVEDYIKKHSKGNPAFALDSWLADPSARAWPTVWQDPPLKELKGLDVKELKEMKGYVEKWDWVLGKKLQARGQ